MKRLIFVMFILFWLACSYISEAAWAGHFCGRFCPVGVETENSAVMSGLLFPSLVGGPLAMLATISLNEGDGFMWDWPKHVGINWHSYSKVRS